VAFAIRDAVDTELIPRAALEPVLAGSRGYWQAVGRLNTVTHLLSAAGIKSGAGPTRAITVLFIDSALWSRIETGPDGLRVEPHVQGAQPGDVVVVTSEAVLAEVLAERLSVEVALASALIMIDGEDVSVQPVRDLLVRGLGKVSLATSRDTPRSTVRFFGPKR
jgi:hypothetical protein